MDTGSTAVFIAKSGGILAQIHLGQEGPIGEHEGKREMVDTMKC